MSPPWGGGPPLQRHPTPCPAAVKPWGFHSCYDNTGDSCRKSCEENEEKKEEEEEESPSQGIANTLNLSSLVMGKVPVPAHGSILLAASSAWPQGWAQQEPAPSQPYSLPWLFWGPGTPGDGPARPNPKITGWERAGVPSTTRGNGAGCEPKALGRGCGSWGHGLEVIRPQPQVYRVAFDGRAQPCQRLPPPVLSSPSLPQSTPARGIRWV